MRRHVKDPVFRPEVILQDAWSEMRWERWLDDGEAHRPWRRHVIDASELTPEEVASRVAAWLREQINSTPGA